MNMRRTVSVLSSVSLSAAMSELPSRPKRWVVRADAGSTIRGSRKALGLSQRDLGLALGYSLDTAQTAVSRLERGDARIDLILQAAAALGIPQLDVLELTDNPFL